MIDPSIIEATLREHGVFVGRPSERRAMAVGATAFVANEADWTTVVTYLTDRYLKDPDRRAGAFAGVSKNHASWEDALTAARAQEIKASQRALKNDPSAYTREDTRKRPTRPPSNCFCADPGREIRDSQEGCGFITDWFDNSDREPELQGRWFCTSCGLEWVVTERGTAGYRIDAPRFGGADPSHGLPPKPAVESKPKTKRKAKPAVEVPKSAEEMVEDLMGGVR